MSYMPTIGLEVHAELRTNTKLFCDSKNDPDEKRPNVNICPICMGHPGTLPVINKEAVRHILKIGIALSGVIADYTEFDRKNYFYPDIPKGYQISQYKYPLVSGGALAGVSITRVHLEEDTARSTHEGENYSLVDFNRAGIPLMELVTDPVMHSAHEAGNFAREFQLLLRTLGASDANMEKGEMRVEANISIAENRETNAESSRNKSEHQGNSFQRYSASGRRQSAVPSATLGTKVEVKNLNSFRAVERAITYEIKRQEEALSKGEHVIQETRGWDEMKGVTFPQRLKESSDDYRYFPEPDLPSLKLSRISSFSRNVVIAELPELPAQKRERYVNVLGLKEEDTEQLLRHRELAEFFEEVVVTCGNDQDLVSRSANYILSDLAGLIQDERVGGSLQNLKPQSFISLMRMIASDELSSRGAKDVLAHLYREGGDAKGTAEELKVLQVSDKKKLVGVVKDVIANNKSVAEEYRGGKESALQYLVGQGMKATKGSGNPQMLGRLLKEELSK